MMNIGHNSAQGAQSGKNNIVCDVTNCVYNNSKKQCTAKEVKVGPQYASSSADTICATFRP